MKHLVLEGAGLDGIAYIGALSKLERDGKLEHVKYFAGSSSGALVASMLAMKVSACDMREFFLEYDLSNAISTNPLRMIWNLFRRFGLFTPSGIRTGLIKLLKKHSDIDPEITFASLFVQTGNFLVVTASSITKRDVVYINPLDHPNIKILDAIEASISIPFIFTPSKLFGMSTDGSLTNGYPLAIFDDDSNMVLEPTNRVSKHTLGIRVYRTSEGEEQPVPTNLIQFIINISTSIYASMQSLENSEEYVSNSITITLSKKDSPSGFSVTRADILKLYTIGEHSVELAYNTERYRPILSGDTN